MSWLPVGDGVVDECGVLEFFEGVDLEDIQVRVVIPKGLKWPVSPVLASVLVTSLKLLVENGKIGLARVIEDFDRGDVFDFLGIAPRELNAYVAEGKLHRAADEIDDEIYFREELLVLRRERLVEVAPVTNLRVLSVYASRGLGAYGGDVVAFSRDVFEWVVLPADGSVVNMPILRRNMEYHEERFGDCRVEVTTPRGEVPMSSVLCECLCRVLWSVLRNGMVEVAGVPRFVAMFDAQALASTTEKGVEELVARGEVGVKWVDGKRRFDREDLLASARRERQRQHDAYERLRQFDLDHPEVWQTYFNPQYGADSETTEET
mgnify:CR=1 FL=1